MSNSNLPLEFSNGIHVAQIRIARPTNQLDTVVRFYRDGLGLPVIGSFQNHSGYDGVMLGLPGRNYHLEFIQYASGAPYSRPSAENLLVLYVTDAEQRQKLFANLTAVGAKEVNPENPYWLDKSRTFVDPDGWRVVICSVVGV
ncbi:VOC family protein [Methylomonas rivi]|uniref:VOC family protein n=1 Tax=Methylomonas rivi TaxID=2952226 RepID=A0ABT1U1Y2_9GAMM|nr:VOC family protein [Methylomonas sp. WSC-6]MCQ8127832.1 VOC family protein [Methylomonas sp. WSC-6]